MTHRDLAEVERFIRRDPARRGLIGAEDEFGPLCPGHLAQAAQDLAQTARSVAIVTGFFIPAADLPAAETDGPPGALLLADVLRHLGIDTVVVTDGLCRDAVCAAADAHGYPRERVIVQESEDESPEARLDRVAAGLNGLTHLVAVERVGPSHTIASLKKQARQGPAPLDRFRARVPEIHRGRCHNVRGEIIDAFAGDLHRLFEAATNRDPAVKTIGIGDGANEIGMGAAPWEDLERRLSGGQSGWLPCRIATDWNIVAGTSNWGAYALAAAVSFLRGRTELLRPFDADQQRQVIEAMVARGPAVDGVTRRREPTVDGLPFLTYIQPWEGVRELLGLA